MTCQTRELAKRIRCISATGCHCKDNYIRDSYTGICMPWNTCPSTIYLNQNITFYTLMTKHLLECLQYENWVCGPNGCGDDEGGYCECKQGYIKNESDDTCILDCDGPKCHENEEYSETGVSVNCLEDKTKRSDGYKGCICNEGFAKNPYTQQCVLKDKCPRKKLLACNGKSIIKILYYSSKMPEEWVLWLWQSNVWENMQQL